MIRYFPPSSPQIPSMSALRVTPALLGASLFLICACQPIRPQNDPGGLQETGGPYAAVQAALADEDLSGARDAIDALLFDEELAKAKQIMATGVPQDALVHVDRALELRPKDPRALELKARGATALADALIAQGAGAVYIEGALFDALGAWRALPSSPTNDLGASEVAYRLGNADLARELGQRVALSAALDPALAERAYRAWSQAAYRVYTDAVQANANRREPLYLEAEDALLSTIGFAPDDLNLRVRLVDLYLWRQDSPQAIAAAIAGLQRIPGERALLERLANAGGTVDDFAALDPGAALNVFYTGRQRLRVAITQLESAPAEGLAAAKQSAKELRQAAEMASADANLVQEALGWRVIAHTVQGWTQFNLGDLDGARSTFESTEELMAGGAEWLIEGQVRSSIDGLFFVGDQHRQLGEWESAAQVFQTLERLQPNDVNWANNAGFFARDAAVALEAEGRDMCALARGNLRDARRAEEVRALAGIEPSMEPPANPEIDRNLLMHVANERFRRARLLAEESYASYLHAAELAPTDVRIINDTALIQVYYLHGDLARAEAFLTRAVSMGAAQLADAKSGATTLDEDELFALTEAYGDAYQNLGVLHLMLLDDPAGAIPYLEQSRDAGPLPRPLITDALIPWCRGELDVPLQAVMPEVNWCAPCTQNN